MDDISNKSLQTTFWALIEKIGLTGVQFFISIILARLLSPQDYGIVALLMVFITIGQVFVDSGFSNALIRKDSCGEKDYSTAFFFNVAVAIIVYFILFFFAPLIASFYNSDILTPVLRVYGLSLLFNSLSIVHVSLLTRSLDFKTMAKCRIISSITSGLIAVLLAYYGFGVWALVFQTIITSLVFLFLMLLSTKWRPKLFFDKFSFDYLWGFGSKMLLSGLISSVYSNMYSLVIGRFYSKSDLGYFDRGQSLATIVPGLIKDSFGKSTYPLLSKAQTNRGMLLNLYRKYTKTISLISFPLVVMAVFLARPIILLLLSDKWEGAIFYMQVFSAASIVGPIGIINLNLIMALGRSDIMLKADIIKKSIGIAVIFALVRFSVQTLAIGSLLLEVFIYSINLYYVNKIMKFSYFRQIRDVISYVCASFLMGGSIYAISLVFNSYITQILVGIIVGFTIYLVALYFIFKDETLRKLLIIAWTGVQTRLLKNKRI